MSAVKILLVEDNPDEEELALIAFERSGVSGKSIFVVRDGQEAVDYLLAEGTFLDRDMKDMPKVIFLDINLPKLNGLEVLKRIRNDMRISLIPVVLLTSSDEESDMLEGYRSGANSFIRKPYDFNEFISNINLLGNYWLNLNLIPNEN